MADDHHRFSNHYHHLLARAGRKDPLDVPAQASQLFWQLTHGLENGTVMNITKNFDHPQLAVGGAALRHFIEVNEAERKAHKNDTDPEYKPVNLLLPNARRFKPILPVGFLVVDMDALEKTLGREWEDFLHNNRTIATDPARQGAKQQSRH